MLKLIIFTLLMFCFSNIYSQILNDGDISCIYSDKNVTCTMVVGIRPYKNTDTIKAKLQFKNIGKLPLFIEKTQNDSVIEYSSQDYFGTAFLYSLLGEVDYLHQLCERVNNIYLREVKPGEEISYLLVVPLKLATDLKGQVRRYQALHVKDLPDRVGIQVNFGYLHKDNPTFPLISKEGKYDSSSQENIIWMVSNIKQFTLGPIYVGVEY